MDEASKAVTEQGIGRLEDRPVNFRTATFIKGKLENKEIDINHQEYYAVGDLYGKIVAVVPVDGKSGPVKIINL